MKGSVARHIGEALSVNDDQHLGEAEDWIIEAIRFNSTHGMMWQLGKDYVVQAKLYKRKGNISIAKESLIKALDILRECGADGWVEKYEKELALLP